MVGWAILTSVEGTDATLVRDQDDGIDHILRREADPLILPAFPASTY